MSAEQYQQLKEILAGAIEYEDEADRSAFVERSCGGDTELLEEANALLEEAEKLLRQPNDSFEAGAVIAKTKLRGVETDREEQRIGAYRVLRELGRGGMGAVYLAERADGEFEKQVAIKILKRALDTDEVLRRFRTERVILARLEHPNIARLLDAGTTDDGLPYFVMEYVDGAAVTRYVRDERLPVEERLRLFLKICGAVEAAHKKMVIHRDLKPGNILVTSEGEPKLLDFGIAKMLTPTAEVTAASEQHLTPTCASPEQARGEAVTAASDIYALGALLFEILAGRRPHRFQSQYPAREEVAGVICKQDPPPPSVAAIDGDTSARLRGDLDAIVLRAMQRDPDRRYPSVAAFADDIRRHLEGKQVRPLPAPNKPYVRRHWLWAAGLLLLAALPLTLFMRRGDRGPVEAPRGAETISAKTIAVLPFENLSSTPEGGFFAAGVQDAILVDLAKIADLRVINPTSVRQYQTDSPRDLRAISEQLKVAYISEGSVQREANRVRVTVKLTDVRSNEQVWAERYDRDISEIFALQSDVAQQIARKMRATVSPTENAALHRTGTNNVAAYDLYLRAKEIERGVGHTPALIREEIELLDQAVAQDPTFVSALCLLARTHLRSYFVRLDPSPTRLDLAKKALAAAARVAPEDGEVHLAEGILLYWGSRNYPAALEKLSQARRNLPNDAQIPFFMGLVERRLGRFEDAIKHLAEAALLDPIAGNVLYEFADVHVATRRYPEAAEILDRLLVWRPDDLTAPYVRAMLDVSARADLQRFEQLVSGPLSAKLDADTVAQLRIRLAMWKRDYEAAAEAFATHPPIDARAFEAVSMHEILRGRIARARGRTAEAQAAFETAREAALAGQQARPEAPGHLTTLALLNAALGNAPEARRLSDEALQRVSVATDFATGPPVFTLCAFVHSRLGEKERALDLLEQSARLPFGVTYGSLMLDDGWDPLRAEPRFHALVASLAPPAAAR